MNNFDPITGQPINSKKAPAPINTRTFLYHKSRPAIVVEGKGETDTDKRNDLAVQIRQKQKEGYSLTRFDGQHPHSFDDHRMERQRREAEAGDKDAQKSLDAKAKLGPQSPATTAPDIDILQQQLAALQAQLDKLTPKSA